MAADRQPDAGTSRRTGDGLALANVDRAREFRRAARRTIIVRMLRIALPVGILALLGGYGFTILRTAGVVEPQSMSEFALRKILPADLVMQNPRYEGYNEDGGKYNFTAKTAQRDQKSADLLRLNRISGELVQADNTRTNISATRGNYSTKTGVLVLGGDIDVNSESGLRVRLTHASLETKQDRLVSAHPVLVEFPNGTVRSKKMTLLQKKREATFSDTVVAELTPPAEDKKVEPDTGNTPPSASVSNSMFTPSNGPIVIESAELNINDGSKKALFTGDVRARQGDANLNTPELEVTYEGEGMLPAGRTPVAAASGASGKVSRIIAKKPVVMKRANGDVVTSDHADFDAAAQTALLTGEVIMTSGVDRRAKSEQVELNEKTGAIVLTGNVVVTQGSNELAGGRFAIDRKLGTAQLTTPPDGADGPGRIKARLARDAQAKVPGVERPEDPDAGAGLASFRTNPSAPIDLNADALDVDDQRKVAIFRGDVDASQDGFKIRCAQLSAFYKGGSGLADIASDDSANDRSEPSSELTRIEARKDVRVMSKDGRSATGDWADFDVKTNKITMGGNVVLSEGRNMVRGTRLLIDLTTGESKIDTAPQNTVAKPSGGGWVTNAPGGKPAAGEGKGRASAVFFPQELKDQDDARTTKAKPEAAPPAADGWSATSGAD